MNDSVSPGKSKLKQNPNPNVAAATNTTENTGYGNQLEKALGTGFPTSSRKPRPLARV